MIRKAATRLLFAAALCCLLPLSAEAQNYRFSVPELRMQVYVQEDASVRLEYEIVFENTPGASPVDVVDVGLFHENYDINRMTASVDGRPVTLIRSSPYVTGVEVRLGPHAIEPGERGTFRFATTMPDMVYQDTTRDDYASLRVTPTWFGEQFVTGRTDLEIAVHMLPDIEGEEVLYQDQPYTRVVLYEGRKVAYWRFDDTRLTGPHMVGVSFPKRGMDRVVTMTKWDLLVLWWEGTPEAQMASGAILVILFAIFFFKMTAMSGWSVFLVIGGVLGWWFMENPIAHLLSLPLWPFIFGLMYVVSKKKKGKQRYLPPIASVEGGGVKRGLTAPTAAVLLEMPVGKVVTLVVFGLLKKQVLRMTNDEPLSVVVEKDYAGNRQERVAKAAERGIVLHSYEHAFVDAIRGTSGTLSKVDLSDAVKGLIDHTVKRVEGFDIEETKKYYKHIIKRAWSQAESLGEVEQRTRAVDKNLEWMLMDDDYQGGFSSWERRGYSYYPLWIGGPRRSYGSTGSLGGSFGGAASSAAGAGGSGGSSFNPSFGDVAGSFAGWTENMAGQAASSIMPSSIGAKSAALDLSGFDKLTTDVFGAMAEGSGGMGGGGGGCAGCACACACAGGGR